jgi:hypothetical protein
MSGVIQSQDLTIAAGASQLVQIAGQVVDFLTSGSAFDTIEVRPDFMQGSAVLKQGQGFDFGAQFTQLLVINKGANALAGTLIISTAGFRNFRISGDVNVLDGGKSRTQLNSAFSTTSSVSAVAAKYPCGQLWNPAGNTKRLIVESMEVGSSVAGGVNIVINQAMLTTDATATHMGCKLAGGVAQSAQIRVDNVAAFPAQTQWMFNSYIQASTGKLWTPKEPLVILPGWGVTAYTNQANGDILANFEWYEEANT